MNTATFTATATQLVARTDAEREARIALLVDRADFAAWSAECELERSGR